MLTRADECVYNDMSCKNNKLIVLSVPRTYECSKYWDSHEENISMEIDVCFIPTYGPLLDTLLFKTRGEK